MGHQATAPAVQHRRHSTAVLACSCLLLWFHTPCMPHSIVVHVMRAAPAHGDTRHSHLVTFVSYGHVAAMQLNVCGVPGAWQQSQVRKTWQLWWTCSRSTKLCHVPHLVEINWQVQLSWELHFLHSSFAFAVKQTKHSKRGQLMLPYHRLTEMYCKCVHS